MSVSPKTFNRLATLLLLTFFTLGITYSVVNPLWEAPDEVGHITYITHLIQNRTLPRQQIGQLGEAHQPPLYYALAAIPASVADLQNRSGAFIPNPGFIWAGQGGTDPNIARHGSAETFPYEGWSLAIHLARATSVLMATATLFVTLAIGKTIFPEKNGISLVGAALTAFNPQFLFISSSVNNDNLLNLLSVATIYQILKAIKSPHRRRTWLIIGVCLALGLLAKTSAIVLCAVAGLALTTLSLQNRSLRLWWRGVVALTLPILLLSGWWFIRNQLLYGDPLGWTMYEKVFATNLRTTPLTTDDIQRFFAVQLQSFWGFFGWMTVPAPHWYDRFTQILTALGAISTLIFFLKFRNHLSTFQKASLLLLTTIILLQELYLLTLITTCDASCYQGRYLFTVIGFIMLLFSAGFSSLLPRSFNRLTPTAIIIPLALISITFPHTHLQPAYPQIPLPKSSLRHIPNKTDYNFDNKFILHGYNIEEIQNQITLTLYWQATTPPDFDYSTFVHLIDSKDKIIDQDDHTLGQIVDYLPNNWLSGDIITDSHQIFQPKDVSTGTSRFRIGLYNWSTGEQLYIFAGTEQSIGSFIVFE